MIDSVTGSRALTPPVTAVAAMAALLLLGCSSSEPNPTSGSLIASQVYISDGSVQCESPALSLVDTANRLNDAGIEVLNSQCGTLTNRAFASVCGGPTPGIHLHTITLSQLDGAEQLGFESVDRLRSGSAGDSDPGFRVIPCQNAKN